MVTVLRVGPDKSEQVWSTIFLQPWVPRSSNLAHPQICVEFANRTSLETLWRGGIRASSCFSWRNAWTGVKCNFSLPHHHASEKSLESSRLGKFECEILTRIGPNTKKLWLSIVPAQRPSQQTGLGPPQKGVNYNFLGQNSTTRTALESFPSRTLKYGVSAGLPKR